MRTHERLSATSASAASGAVAALCPHLAPVGATYAFSHIVKDSVKKANSSRLMITESNDVSSLNCMCALCCGGVDSVLQDILARRESDR
jgi:hypothetical protein